MIKVKVKATFCRHAASLESDRERRISFSLRVSTDVLAQRQDRKHMKDVSDKLTHRLPSICESVLLAVPPRRAALLGVPARQSHGYMQKRLRVVVVVCVCKVTPVQEMCKLCACAPEHSHCPARAHNDDNLCSVRCCRTMTHIRNRLLLCTRRPRSSLMNAASIRCIAA